MRSLSERLDQIRRQAPESTSVHSRAPALVRRSLSETLGGREVVRGGQRCWCVESKLDAKAHSERAIRRLTSVLGASTCGRANGRPAVAIDIETGGFSGAPVFLIGLVRLDERPWRVEQWLARDYPEERAILERLAERAGRAETWVTFNGKSFDAPFLRERAVIHRVRLAEPREHVDVLHAARRRWRGELPDCRLETLERQILRRVRQGDVGGGDVPALFHTFIRTGNAAPLRPVLAHNRRDLAAMIEILARLADGA
jgi:uncharacterized protein YprB with RNaseH-like and TPR domain